ncbi:hypothetical protein [Streptomyces sp. NBC_00197]|uniref:hypothetical protein n=1 Tax=Streptomyces sp. NBC_00197 TaxID=2975676 RepID=UPI0032446D7F
MKVNDSTPEDDEPTSLVAKTRNLYRKHRGKILAVGGAVAGVALAVVVARHTMEQNVTEDTEDTGSDAPPESTSEPRQPPKHHLRNLPEGWSASDEKKAQYKEETGDDLAPGTTWVHPSEDEEDEDPGEAAA